MKSQFYADRPSRLPLAWGRPLRLAGAAGEFTVLSGRVWLTRQGDLDDHVLGAGERFALRAGDVAVVEAWQRGQDACVAWQPRAQRRVLGLARAPAAACGPG
ncbi:MAG TPA: DUF2917 domain-containing protein [Albitalea sp.]|nr:DUF2917 domain-containing protein [Albitalea sp.]